MRKHSPNTCIQMHFMPIFVIFVSKFLLPLLQKRFLKNTILARNLTIYRFLVKFPTRKLCLISFQVITKPNLHKKLRTCEGETILKWPPPLMGIQGTELWKLPGFSHDAKNKNQHFDNSFSFSDDFFFQVFFPFVSAELRRDETGYSLFL